MPAYRNKKEWLADAVKMHLASHGNLPPMEQPCLIWPWAKLTFGHGRITIKKRHFMPAHRYAYELINGPFSRELQALHHCDNPPCVNPSHIYPGTPADNIHDCVRRGRHKHFVGPGENNPNSKLSANQVREIITLKGTKTATEVGGLYGVSVNQICWIWNGKAWRHLPRL